MPTSEGRNVIFGAIILVVGLAFTVGDVQTGDFGVIAYGAILIGGGMLVFGLFQLLPKSKSTAEQLDVTLSDTELNAIVKAMISIAIADRVLAEEEVTMIDTTFETVTGIRLDKNRVRALAQEAQMSSVSVPDELRAVASEIGETTKSLIIRACYIIVTADGVTADSEMVQLKQIGKAIGLSDAEYEALVDDLTGAKSNA